jgi:hypothetical protein
MLAAELEDTLAELAASPVAALTSQPVVDSTAAVAAASTVVEAVLTAAADTAKSFQLADGCPSG